MIGLFHTSCGVLSLLLGALIFLSTKGTKLHIRLGWAYVASMLCVNLTSLALYHLTGGPNIFHALAVLNLFMVVAGVVQVVFRHRLRRWLWRHYQYMSWSYVGLLAATNNEAFVRISPLKRLAARSSDWLPISSVILLMAISALLIFTKQKYIFARYGRID